MTKEFNLYFAPRGSGGVVVLNRVARRVLNTFSRPVSLAGATRALPDLSPADVHQAVHQLVDLALLCPAGRQPALRDPGATTLTAWLHVTSACTLRCAYCYAPRGTEKMTWPVGEAALEAIFRSAARHDYQAVKLKYAGGEPLLNFPLIRALQERAEVLAHHRGMGLRAVVLSNGTLLTDEMLAFLRAAGVRLMISLDGVGPSHDRQRPRADGRGSFELVARNIDRALAGGLKPHLSITVTGHSLEAPAGAVAFALARDLPFNLNFVRESGPGGQWTVDEFSLIEAVRRAFRRIEASLPQQTLVAGLLDRASFVSPHLFPCGAGHHYLVVDQAGGVAPCQMDLGRPVGDVWMPDPLAAVRDGGTFHNISVQEKDGCRTCPWRYACAGVCPRLVRQGTGVAYCRAYQTLFPELVRLEGLRLLAQEKAMA
ncbi:MAG: radical SAM protein [Anaerolineae bacterium]